VTHIRYVTDEEVRHLVPISLAIELVEQALRAEAEGRVSAFTAMRAPMPDGAGTLSLRSAYLPDPGILGVTAGGYWPHNPERFEVGARQASVLLLDPASGHLKGMVAGSFLSTLVAGAAGAIAARLLARPAARRVGLIGAGLQADMQLRALAAQFAIERVAVWSPDGAEIRNLMERLFDLDLVIRPARSPEEAAGEADILAVTMRAREPLLQKEWLQPGVHINTVDAGRLPVADRAPSIGALLVGTASGRESPDEVTLCDVTEPAAADLLVASHAWDLALHRTLEVAIR
jgi:ornithine cyclodeaminase/alanine dehydrogenase-like protein (mu-crystallin family)